jgi:hypothetical protein
MAQFFPKVLQSGPTEALAKTALLAGAVALYAALHGDLVSPAAAAGDYDVGSMLSRNPGREPRRRVRHRGPDI